MLQQMLSTLPSSRNTLSILAEHAAANSLEFFSRNYYPSHMLTLAVGNKRLLP